MIKKSIRVVKTTKQSKRFERRALMKGCAETSEAELVELAKPAEAVA